jgi:hypothetical protein
VLRIGLVALVAVLVLAATAGSGSGSPDVSSGATPRCYGAADRDRAHPCANPALRTQVTPSPDEAVLIPDAACEPDGGEPPRLGCRFGVPAASARATIALLGDSHAASWRAALVTAGDEARWHGVSLTKASCPFSLAPRRTDAAGRAACGRWNQRVIAWLRAHPEVREVFVAAHAAAPVVVTHGRTPLQTRIAGYVAAWDALPPTVRRIFVLRDVPTRPSRTAACMEAALAAQRPAVPACAVRREGALRPDPQVVAARRRTPPRVRVIDLTTFMCAPRTCYPVVGGVLVTKDTNHLTRAFSTTLGPYVLRRVRALRQVRG